MHQVSPCGIRAFHGKGLCVFVCVCVCMCVCLVIPLFGLLSHISALRLSSGHSGLVLTIRTDDPAHTSPPSPYSMVVDAKVRATSPLAVAVRHIFCGLLLLLFFFFFLLLLMLPSEIPKLPTDTPVRGFPTVWKLFLLHDSLPRMGFHP